MILRWALILTLLILGATGCASGPYRYGGKYHTELDPPLPPDELQVERGQPRPILDGVGWVVGTPKRVLLLKWNVDNHRVSDNTEYQVREYIARNRLDKVKVQINEYDPAAEWARLKANQSINAPLRYSVGAIAVAGYTLFPGRIWGGDNFSPWTNTVHLYSDVPELAIYQAAQAKECAKREYKWFGSGKLRAAGDTIAYFRNDGAPDQARNAYACLVPTVVADFVPLWAWTTVGLPALGAGHVAGRAMGLSVQDKPAPSTPADPQRQIAPGVVRLPSTDESAFSAPNPTISDSPPPIPNP